MPETAHPGWYRIELAYHDEPSGTLGVVELGNGLPFAVQRVFWLFGMPDAATMRGDHTHEALQQVLFCARGSCTISVENREGTREEIELAHALRWLKDATASRGGRVATVARALLRGTRDSDRGLLARMDLAEPTKFADRLRARLLSLALRQAARRRGPTSRTAARDP